MSLDKSVVTSVLEFGTGAGAGLYYVAETDPAQVVVNEPFRIKLYSRQEFELRNAYGIESSKVLGAPLARDESIDVNGSRDISTQYPVADLTQATAKTPIMRKRDGECIALVHPKGATVPLIVVDGRLRVAEENLFGTLSLQYMTHAPQIWPMPGLLPAGMYYFCLRSGTFTDMLPVPIGAAGDANTDGDDHFYKIDNTDTTATVYSRYAHRFELANPYGPTRLSVSLPEKVDGIEISETVQVGDGNVVQTSYPVDNSFGHNPITDRLEVASGLVDIDRQQLAMQAGFNITSRPSLYDVEDSRLILTSDRRLRGYVTVGYRTTPGRKWTADGPKDIPGGYICFINGPGGSVDQVTFDFFGAHPPSLVEIEIRDYCSDLPVEGATVTIVGTGDFVTDANGVAYPGILNAGNYAVRISADGYRLSQFDGLNNDEFTV